MQPQRRAWIFIFLEGHSKHSILRSVFKSDRKLLKKKGEKPANVWGWQKQKSEDLKRECYVVVLHSDIFPRLSLLQFIRDQILTVSVKMLLNILSEETTQTSRWLVKTSVDVYFRPRSASQINNVDVINWNFCWGHSGEKQGLKTLFLVFI